MSISRHNKGESKFTYPVGKDLPYKKLSELYGATNNPIIVRSFFKNTKSKFGENYIIAVTLTCDKEVNNADICINLPQHLNETVEEILEDQESIDQINKGKAGIIIEEYEEKTYKRTCYSVQFVDL